MNAPTHPGNRRAVALAYGVLCHTTFVIGVATMIGMMFFGMSRSLGTLPGPWNWICNAFLLLQFPLLHSWMLTRGGRALLRRLAPPDLGARLVTTTYVIIASIQTLLLFALWTPSGTVWWRAEGNSLAVMIGLYTVSWLLLLKSIVDAGIGLQTGLLGWWAVFRNRSPVYPPMPVRGLFRLCRQPIYVAFTLTLWTVPTWTPDQLTVATVLSTYCLIGPIFKESRFRRMFGEAFESYRRAVPYWLPTRGVAAASERSADKGLIYDTYAVDWWSGKRRWLRTLQNLVPARLEHFDRYVKEWRGCRVLDLGCGGGFMAEALAERGASVTGVDPSSPALAIARAHAQERGLTIAYTVGTGECIPAPDASFDHVVCVDVLEHVADTGRLLAEVRRVLRPGGLFLFDTINRTPLAKFVMVGFAERIFRLLPSGTHNPAKFIKPHELRGLLVAARLHPADFAGLGPRGLNRRLDFTFGALPTQSIMYVGAASSRCPAEARAGASQARPDGNETARARDCPGRAIVTDDRGPPEWAPCYSPNYPALGSRSGLEWLPKVIDDKRFKHSATV